MAKAKTNKTTSPLGICQWLKNCDCLQNVQNLLRNIFLKEMYKLSWKDFISFSKEWRVTFTHIFKKVLCSMGFIF